MPKATLAEIVSAFKEADSFLITTHATPDGDAIGSMLGLYHLLLGMGKNDVRCVSDDDVPRLYSWLPGAEIVERTDECSAPIPAKMAIILDAATRMRLGRSGELAESNATWTVIDHHQDERAAADYAFIDPTYSAVGEIIAEMFEIAEIPLTEDAAACLYVSIITDTGGFKYANTTPRTHRIAAKLLEAGIDATGISSRVFDVMTLPKFAILKRVIERIQRVPDGRVAYSMLTQKDMRETSARNEDVDGLINFARNLEGVEVGIMFRETSPLTTKVSMRSRGSFNCGLFLENFGGGGHVGAAGATIEMSLNETKRMMLERVRTELGALA
jgi:phosphoesterase RecJ-like protein